MNLPQIGTTITTGQALKLCRHFDLLYLVNRMQATPGNYKNWVFDGCSTLPDELLGLFTGCNWRDISYKCCLPHDLCYAYGEPENDIERQRVDVKFYSDLINKAGMLRLFATAFLAAVRVGGHEKLGLSFSWGFANITASAGGALEKGNHRN